MHRSTSLPVFAALAAIALLGLAACHSAPPAETAAGTPSAQDSGAIVYVLRRGRHTDLVLPVAQLRGPLAGLGGDFPGARYLVFGFNDRQYVLASHKNLAHTLLAPLPGPGLLLVSGIAATPAEVYGADRLAAIELEPQQAEAIDRFVWQSLQADAAGAVHPYMPGQYPGNLYFASSKTYYGLYTCNTWTADALENGGVPLHSAGVLFAGQVWDQVKRIDRGQAAPDQRPDAVSASNARP